jgi:hypothetical protein
MRLRCCLCVYVLLGNGSVKTKPYRLARNVTAVTNTHTTIEEFLDASFPTWPVSY